jgi:CRP/FNR family transcriptional regulator
MKLTNTLASTTQPSDATIGKKYSAAIQSTSDRCQTCCTKTACEAQSLVDNLSGNENKLFFRTHRINKGQHLFYAGEQLDTLYLVKSGLFKSYFNSEVGDEQVMGFHMPGEVLGADAIAHHPQSISAVAIEPSMVCALPIKKLESSSHHAFSAWLLKQVYQEVLRERKMLLVSGRKYNAEARVACFLLELSARNHARGYSEQEFKLSMPHRDIAHYLDMALETVSRVFTRLQDNGLLIFERPYVKITDVGKLRSLAGIHESEKQLLRA